jgi:ligand-binding SRPBCC domain-containing protein
MIHKLYRQQQLHCDIGTAWKFFSSPSNLPLLTPKSMNFTVKSRLADESIYEGMIIDYNVAPLFGIRLNWRTEITAVVPEKSFTDLQVKGPYKLWKHLHEFIPNKEGVLMKDTVEYQLRHGKLGDLVHVLFVSRKLNDIFDYRQHVLEEFFNPGNAMLSEIF